MHPTGSIYALQVLYTPYRFYIHPTGSIIYTLQVLYTPYRFYIHPTGLTSAPRPGGAYKGFYMGMGGLFYHMVNKYNFKL